ncbi:hypothetical protein L3V83_03605 [Thiotrichales bacterium 19X7-9]|nr:hypothetical protein [Thiotrichales bacterium 19X7-9]
MSTLLNDLCSGISVKEQRELYEELFTIYSSSSKDKKLYHELLINYSNLLMQLNYQDRLASLNKVIKIVEKRHGNPEEPNPLNIFVNAEGHFSKLKHGAGPWVGVDFFPEWNYSRLLALRLKRLADAIAQALHSDALKNTIDKANPAISALGILWYVPRFLRHTSLIVKHTKSGNLDYTRKHAFEWFNDLAWLATGTMTFGMSTGLYLTPLTSVLGPGGIYLTVALYGFDCLNQAIKSYQKIQKMNRIINKLDNKINSLCTELNINNDLNLPNSINQLKQKNQSEEQRLKYYAKLKMNIPPEKYQALAKRKNNIKKLESAIEMRDRIKLKKRYTKRQQWAKLGVAAGLFLGMAVSLIGGPYAPIIGAAIVIATCAAQYYAKNYYLPKEEIRFSYDPLEELHNRLTKHCEDQIEKLTKALESAEDGSKTFDNTEHKLQRYQQIEMQLKQWQNADTRDPNQLHQIMQDIIQSSQLQRKRNITPSSAKELKNILRVFDTQWETKSYKYVNNDNISVEEQFKNSIRNFVENTTNYNPANYFREAPMLIGNDPQALIASY